MSVCKCVIVCERVPGKVPRLGRGPTSGSSAAGGLRHPAGSCGQPARPGEGGPAPALAPAPSPSSRVNFSQIPEPLRAKEGQFFVQVNFLLPLLIKILTLLRSRRGSFPCFFLPLHVFLFVLRFHYFAKGFFFLYLCLGT